MIRKASIHDLDSIWDLRLKTSALLKIRGVDQWQSILPNQAQFINDIENGEFYVLVIEQKIVAMMALKKEIEHTYDVIYDGKWRYDIPYMTIHRIAVDKDFSGHGYGTDLLNYAKKVASSLGYHYLRIDTHQDNQAAIKRFTDFGFVYCGYILLAANHPTDRKRLAFDLKWE